jgi:hypothetical protein
MSILSENHTEHINTQRGIIQELVLLHCLVHDIMTVLQRLMGDTSLSKRLDKSLAKVSSFKI